MDPVSEDEGDRLVRALWSEMADEEAPPPGLETRLAARARSMGRTRRLGWLGWSTAGFAVAGLALYVAGGSDPGALSEGPPTPRAPAEAPVMAEPEPPPAVEVLSAPPAEEVRDAPARADEDRTRAAKKAARALAKDQAPKVAPPAAPSPKREAQSGPASRRPSPERLESGGRQASKQAAKRSVLGREVRRTDRFEGRAEEDGETKADLEVGGLGSGAALEAAPSSGGAAAPRPPDSSLTPNARLRAALLRLASQPPAERRSLLVDARGLVRSEVDRAEWMWAEVGLLQAEGQSALAERRLRQLVELGTPAQRARARRALSD